MLRISVIPLLAFTFIISGCMPSASLPQNPEEYRASINETDHMLPYTVDLSYKTVINSLKKHTKKCLDKTIESKATDSYGHVSKSYIKYNPKLNIGKNKSVLTLQYNATGAASFMKVPEGGMYYVLVDITSHGKKNTKVRIYAPKKFEEESVFKAIKGWTQGHNTCPDMTRALEELY